MGFLSSLSGVINNQFGIGESTGHSIENEYTDLGKSSTSNKIDTSAERTYIEDGFIRDLRPRTRSILFQQPDIFVVVKKRMFSTLVDNSRLDLLEEKERILIAATKRLFQNKCRILSAYEKLTKIEQLSFESGRFNTYLAPSLFTLFDSVSLISKDAVDGNLKSALDTLRKVISYSEPGISSNWTTNDWDAVFSSQIGEGPGTFELTNISSVKTSVSTEWGGGSANLSIEDPYNLLTITEKDIDQALTDVTNPMRTGSTFKFAENELQKQIDDLKSELAVERYNRNASQITFKLANGTVISKKVRAVLDDEGVEIQHNYSTGIQQSFSGFESAKNFSQVATSVGNLFSTGGVEIEPQFLTGNDPNGISPRNQLTPSEQEKFSSIISNVYTLLDQRTTSRRDLKKRNAEVNYARNRMRLFFNGKFIIQPMDTITIWMTSRTDEDQRLPGGFAAQQAQSGVGVIKKFDSILKNINTQLSMFSSGESWDDIERIAIVGEGMPKWLWRQFRQDITSQPTGPCIFSGIVGKGGQGVSGNWSDGKWMIDVSCEDNTGFFDKGLINFKPAADVFNASIYDPLTPFDVSFDAATGVPITSIGEGDFPPLLPENQKLLLSGLCTFRSGPNKGQTVTEKTYKEPTKEISFGDFRAVLHDPDGMVYRWKQGIQTLTDTSRPNKTVSIDQERTVLLTNQPFAGQDIMNVISLLVTGKPYNYETFLTAAIANGNSLGVKDDATNIPAASTYIQGLVADIEKQNLIWGNFIPYKKLVINPELDSFITQQKLDIITQNSTLNQKLAERARVQDELTLLQGGFFVDPSAFIGRDDSGRAIAGDDGDPGGKGSALQTRIASLGAEIKTQQDLFSATVSNQLANNPNIGLTLVGNELNANPTLSSIDDAKSSTAQKQRDELQLRKNLFRFTARRFWQVRANEDKNLFIVDDQYDKNLDIQAFERKIGSNIELFNSQYTHIGDQITGVKKLLGLECFANTQGHIEVRPPAYNKIPSSVFYQMFKNRDQTGVKVFPDFLENLYFNQIRGIFNQLEVVEDEIRLRAVALGAKDDKEIIQLIIGKDSPPGTSAFSFITKFDGEGRVGEGNIKQLLVQSHPDFAESVNVTALEELTKFSSNTITKQAKISVLFPPAVQASAATSFNPNVQPDKQEDAVEAIRDRLRIKTGREPKKLQELFGNPKFRRLYNVQGAAVSQVDRLNIMSQIGTFLSQRQTLMLSVSKAIKSLAEGVSINAPDIQNQDIFHGGLNNLGKPSGSNKTASALTTPFLNRKTQIPQLLEHMIEDEESDDLGPQSGRRFVLTADRIISLTISENPPPYTMITVKGLFGQGFTDAPSSLNQSDGGNAVTSAYAVDYDMWYQYGFKAPQAIEAPFLSDPDSQCAPYAVATLLQARENILQGSVEVAGYNEFYQPGDVVYIEDRNLLFYVRSVSHMFSYGKLSTTLELSYGHSPGEYIPTMLDVVGKIMYNAKGFTGQFRSHRFEMVGSARSIGALAFVQSSKPKDNGTATRLPEGSDPLQLLLSGRYGERNKKTLGDTLFAVSGSLNQVSFRSQKTRIKIVYYVTEDSNESEMDTLANKVVDWLINPESNDPNNVLSPASLTKDGSGRQKSFGLNKDDILIEKVDLTDPEKQTRQVVFPEEGDITDNNQGPSSAAFQVTRAVDTADSSPDQFSTLLANTVLDIFVDYQLSAGTQSGTGVKTGEKRGDCTMSISESDVFSERGIDDNSAIDAARDTEPFTERV